MAEQMKSQEKGEERLVRIMSKDIEGKMRVYAGLTKIKGVSWAFSNAVCKILKIDKRRKIGSLTDEEIQKISDFIKNPKLPDYILNRRRDADTGDEKHLTGTDLDLRKDFDIKKSLGLIIQQFDKTSGDLSFTDKRKLVRLLVEKVVVNVDSITI